MAIVPSEYWVRVKITEASSEVAPHACCNECGAYNAYHAAMSLAQRLAEQNPELTFEVAQDKVWSTARYHVQEESSGSQELQDTRDAKAPRRDVHAARYGV